MKVLLVTEKCNPSRDQRDGGARVVDTLKSFLKEDCAIAQFGGEREGSATYHFDYPHHEENRFIRRLKNSSFIGEKIQKISAGYSHILFIHVSMQFGLELYPIDKETIVWTFPMFLTPSYRSAGERVPEEYFVKERRALALSTAILTPSPFEKRQIHEVYGIDENKIYMVPRGVDASFAWRPSRTLESEFLFCSLGSIKPQKNTMRLVNLFAALRKRFSSARLRLIGPIQDPSYAATVFDEIERLELKEFVELSGFVKPADLTKQLSDCHFHLSTSHCETFGRSIFETLSIGLPNILVGGDHAAGDFLRDLPYIAFVNDLEEAVKSVEEMARNYERISSLSKEIGELYSDLFLGRLLTATLFNQERMIVSDFDGTLFHKNDEEQTLRSIAAFNQFPVRVISSARSLESLLIEIKRYQIKVDWIIAFSGAVLADGSGGVIWKEPLTAWELDFIERGSGRFFDRSKGWSQIALPKEEAPSDSFLRAESYKGEVFFNHWRASKLHALCRLLKEINWTGQVAVYGDGVYDREMITYFDGKWVTPYANQIGERKEILYV